MYHLDIIQATVFACCDFIAQLVLVRTTGDAYYLKIFIYVFQDIPLLDRVGS